MQSDTSDYLFVYGTLQSAFSNEWSSYLKENSRFVSKAKMPGRLYKIDFYPGAVYDPNSNSFVYGELFYSRQILEVIKQIDRYEGCAYDDPLPHEYIKKIVPVCTKNEQIDSWCYLYNFDTSASPIIGTGCFM